MITPLMSKVPRFGGIPRRSSYDSLTYIAGFSITASSLSSGCLIILDGVFLLPEDTTLMSSTSMSIAVIALSLLVPFRNLMTHSKSRFEENITYATMPSLYTFWKISSKHTMMLTFQSVILSGSLISIVSRLLFQIRNLSSEIFKSSISVE
ncbi:hypothetical protein RIR_jg33839.t1 [Rhizophagus irregularis DAOM 181602=DAOM 197198]|nr:hypothetical protein RIR_jg33839.t1 [Rhizophagus irregularis DAOM 181602=DAOM 197198]